MEKHGYEIWLERGKWMLSNRRKWTVKALGLWALKSILVLSLLCSISYGSNSYQIPLSTGFWLRFSQWGCHGRLKEWRKLAFWVVYLARAPFPWWLKLSPHRSTMITTGDLTHGYCPPPTVPPHGSGFLFLLISG